MAPRASSPLPAPPCSCNATSCHRGDGTRCSGHPARHDSRKPASTLTESPFHESTRERPVAQPAQPPHPADRHRRHHRRRPVPRLRQGDPRRGTGTAARLCRRRHRDLLHHARARGAAHLPPRGRLVRHLRGGVLRTVRRLRHRLVVLVHVGRHRHGGAHGDRHLHALLVSGRAAVAAGARRAGAPVRREPARRAGVRRARVLVRAHQGAHHRGADRGGPGGDRVPRRQLSAPRRASATSRRTVASCRSASRPYCSPCRSSCSPTRASSSSV